MTNYFIAGVRKISTYLKLPACPFTFLLRGRPVQVPHSIFFLLYIFPRVLFKLCLAQRAAQIIFPAPMLNCNVGLVGIHLLSTNRVSMHNTTSFI
jgi:hypothetical protein